MDRKQMGDHGERIAEGCLKQMGMEILARNVRIGGGELDIIALDGDVVVIVEVKARSAPGERPAQAVTRGKIRKISRAALAWLAQRGWLEREIRFDVVEVLDGGAQVRCEHTPSAFWFDASVLS